MFVKIIKWKKVSSKGENRREKIRRRDAWGCEKDSIKVKVSLRV